MKITEKRRIYNREYLKKMRKEVKRAYGQKYYQKNKDKVKDRVKKYYTENRSKRLEISRKCHLKRVFGLSIEEYENILKNQNGGCAICGRKKEKINLAVDHSHKTGKIRGILCMKCNHGIGYFNDDVLLLEKAIKYINNN